MRRPLEVKLKHAQVFLKQLEAEHSFNDSLNNKRKEVAKQVRFHQKTIEAMEREHAAQLRQLLYVVDPTPVTVRFDVRPGYENIVTPLATQKQKEAALTGAEEMRRFVSAKIIVGDVFFEHEADLNKRSRYWIYRRVLLTEDAGTRVVVHEFGHAIERLNDQIKRRALEFRDRRTQGESDIPLNQFDSDYGPQERTRKDKFVNPYMGKIYPKDSDTEIITMGIEYFYSDPVKLAVEDPEYFDFIYDTLRGH